MSHETPNFKEFCVRVGAEVRKNGWVGGATANHELEKGPESNTEVGADGSVLVALMLSEL